jgi:hypothetical protein
MAALAAVLATEWLRGDYQRPATAQRLVRAQPCNRRSRRARLSCCERRDTRSRGLDPLWRRAKDPEADAARREGRERRPGTGTGSRPILHRVGVRDRVALDPASPPDGIGHLHRAARGVSRRAALAAQLVFLHPRHAVAGVVASLVCGEFRGVPGGNGEQGGDGRGATPGVSLRQHVRLRVVACGMASPRPNPSRAGSDVAAARRVDIRHARSWRVGRPRRRDHAVALPADPVPRDRPLPAAGILAASAGARLRDSGRHLARRGMAAGRFAGFAGRCDRVGSGAAIGARFPGCVVLRAARSELEYRAGVDSYDGRTPHVPAARCSGGSDAWRWWVAGPCRWRWAWP